MTDHEAMAAALEATGDYRVLRRLRRTRSVLPSDDDANVGVVIDQETTGFDPAKDEVIDLAMIRFRFRPDGTVCAVEDSMDSLRDPGRPIPQSISKLTKITDAMVAGKAIDGDEVNAFIADASIIISHFARFDRPFAERLNPHFAEKCWGCSLEDVDWQSESIESGKLGWILQSYGIFYDAHRAIVDCEALIELLSKPLPVNEGTVLRKLLATARVPTMRCWAIGAPFEAKNALKARGYRWNDGSDGRSKAWWIDTRGSETDDEADFLRTVCGRAPQIQKITAFDRYSRRI